MKSAWLVVGGPHLKELGVVNKVAIDYERLAPAVVLGDHQAAEDGADILHLGVHPLRLVAPAQDVYLRAGWPTSSVRCKLALSGAPGSHQRYGAAIRRKSAPHVIC